MAEYSSLLAHITSVVKANDNQEITGTNMQSVLTDMVSQLGAQQLKGVAVPTTMPSIPSGFATYFATQAGVYSGFGITIETAGLYLLDWNATTALWELEQIPISSGGSSLWSRDNTNGVLYPATVTDKVAIGSTAATRTLDIAGTLRVRTLVDNLNYANVLVSDVDGNVDRIPKAAVAFEKLDKFSGYDRLTVPQGWDIVINDAANTVTLGTIDTVPISSTNPLIIYTTDYLGAPVNTRRITAPVVFAVPDTIGWWYLSFKPDGSTHSAQTIPSALNVPLCYVYNNGTSIISRTIRTYPGTLPVVALERFKKNGALVYNGFNIFANPLTTGTPAADGSQTCISLTRGTILEGNLYYTVENSQTPAAYGSQPSPASPPAGSYWTQDLGASAAITALNAGMFGVTYRSPAGTLTRVPATRFPFPTSGGVIAYYTQGGVLTPVPSGTFVCMFVYVVQDWINGQAVRVITATTTHGSIALADQYNWENVLADMGNTIGSDVRQLVKLIFESRSTYPSGVNKAALRKVVDIRTQAYTLLSVSSSTIIDQNVELSALPSGYTSTNQMEMNLELASKIAAGGDSLWTNNGGILQPTPAYGRVYAETNENTGIAIHGYGVGTNGIGIKGEGNSAGVFGESGQDAGRFKTTGGKSLSLDAAGYHSRFISFSGDYGSLPDVANISNMNGDGAVIGPKAPGTGAGWQYRGMLKIEVIDNVGNPLIMWLPYYEYETQPSQ